MKRIKLLGLILIAVFATTAITATAAYAENPEILFKKGALPVKLKFTSNEGTLLSEKAVIECKKDKGEAELTTSDAGTWTVEFTECTAASGAVKCRSLGDKTGTILTGGGLKSSTGSFKLVTLTLSGGTLSLGAILELPTSLLHIECEILLILVGGSVIGEFLNITSGVTVFKKGTKTKFDVEAPENKQQFTKCVTLKAVCEGKTFELYTEVSGVREKGAETSNEETEVTSENEFTIDF